MGGLCWEGCRRFAPDAELEGGRKELPTLEIEGLLCHGPKMGRNIRASAVGMLYKRMYEIVY
jgi:hypothetical protein